MILNGGEVITYCDTVMTIITKYIFTQHRLMIPDSGGRTKDKKKILKRENLIAGCVKRCHDVIFAQNALNLYLKTRLHVI